MTFRLGVFLLAAAVLVLALSGLVITATLRAKRDAKTAWASLLHKLKAVDRESLARVARDCDDAPESPSVGLTPDEITVLLGGMEGLLKLESNCDVLIEMAAYVQRWHPEAVLVAEEFRLNAREIRWHVSRLKGAAEIGKLDNAFPTYGQKAATVYYGMTQTLLTLYTTTGLPEAAQLQSAF